jgi:hypothetical protein
LGVIVEDTDDSAEHSDEFGRKNFQKVSGVGGDSSLIAELDWRDQFVVLSIVDHLLPPEIPEQHIKIRLSQLDHAKKMEMEVAFLFA